MKFSADTSNASVEWCRSHDHHNRLGVALLDRAPVNPDFPHVGINVLIRLAIYLTAADVQHNPRG